MTITTFSSVHSTFQSFAIIPYLSFLSRVKLKGTKRISVNFKKTYIFSLYFGIYNLTIRKVARIVSATAQEQSAHWLFVTSSMANAHAKPTSTVIEPATLVKTDFSRWQRRMDWVVNIVSAMWAGQKLSIGAKCPFVTKNWDNVNAYQEFWDDNAMKYRTIIMSRLCINFSTKLRTGTGKIRVLSVLVMTMLDSQVQLSSKLCT